MIIFHQVFSYTFVVIFVRYEVSEKKYFEIFDIIEIKNYEYEFTHLETTFEFERYNLDVTVEFVDSSLDERIRKFNLPIELNTTMTEQLTAEIKNLQIEINKNEGIYLIFKLDVEVIEINTLNEEIKEEIKETYQYELEEKLEHREEEIIEEIVVNDLIVTKDKSDDFILKNLKNDYVKYKVLSLDENSLDKISAKYNLPISYLFDLKKDNKKAIIYDKE